MKSKLYTKIKAVAYFSITSFSFSSEKVSELFPEKTYSMSYFTGGSGSGSGIDSGSGNDTNAERLAELENTILSALGDACLQNFILQSCVTICMRHYKVCSPLRNKLANIFLACY